MSVRSQSKRTVRPHAQETVVLQNDQLVVAELFRNPSALRLGQDDASERVQYGLGLVECAAVLGRVLEGETERRPRFAVRAVRVADRLDVGARLVDGAMDKEPRSVYNLASSFTASNHLSGVADRDDVLGRHDCVETIGGVGVSFQTPRSGFPCNAVDQAYAGRRGPVRRSEIDKVAKKSQSPARRKRDLLGIPSTGPDFRRLRLTKGLT
jgi:hypothetical protein